MDVAESGFAENSELAIDPDGSAIAPVDAERERHRLRRMVRTTLLLLLILGIVRVFVFEPYAIPTGSMRPTIIEGDVLLVNKLPYVIRTLRTVPFTHVALPYLEIPGLGSLERGDVVVFDFPEESGDPAGIGEAFVKRVAALGGDTVQLVGGRVCINGRETPPGGASDHRGDHRGERCAPIDQRRAVELLRYGGSVVVPYEGMVVPLDSVAAARWSSLIYGEGSTVEYRNRIVFIDGLPATYYTFRRDYFFALGDNSGDSHDSRFFGFVPVDNLIGQAAMVYWSRNPVDGIRWDRIGKAVR
jgi:signal peptidase I